MLRNRTLLGCKFRRQFPIDPYVADFVCVEKLLVVELDGGQHVEDAEHDEERTSFLKGKGFTVLRFWNDDVLLRTDDVLEQVLRNICAEGRPSP